MLPDYKDIKSRITEEPAWYDENGVPRYGDFVPENIPNIYANHCALLRIACQDCGAKFKVAMNDGIWNSKEFNPKQLHYGDPPRHNCVGDTMNCDDLDVLEVWCKQNHGWVRVPELEGVIE